MKKIITSLLVVAVLMLPVFIDQSTMIGHNMRPAMMVEPDPIG